MSLPVGQPAPVLTTGRKITFILVCWLVAAVLVTASGEVYARFKGHKVYQPWRAEAADVRVVPGGAFLSQTRSSGINSSQDNSSSLSRMSSTFA